MNADRDFERSLYAERPNLHTLAIKLTRGSADADDLVQEALLRAWRYRANFTPGTNMRAWLRGILRNVFINYYRRLPNTQKMLEHERVLAEQRELEYRDPVDVALSDEMLSALDALAPQYREVLRLRALEELTCEETAERLGCPLGTVLSRTHRACRSMADALKKAG